MDLYSTERATTTHASGRSVDPNDYWFSRYTSDRIPAIFTPSTTRFRCCLIIGYIASFAPSASPTEVPYYWPLGTWLSTGYFSFSYNAIPMFSYQLQTQNDLYTVPPTEVPCYRLPDTWSNANYLHSFCNLISIPSYQSGTYSVFHSYGVSYAGSLPAAVA